MTNMKTNPHDAAVKTAAHYNGPDGENNHGLTKKEHFAALALQGLCANMDTDERPLREMAEMACYIADVLIIKLNDTVK